MSDPRPVPPRLEVEDKRRLIALSAHLRQVVRAVVDGNGRFARPILCDPEEVLLASASLRALFFDDSPAPLLLDLASEAPYEVHIETLETTGSMLLMSHLGDFRSVHTSDLLAKILMEPAMSEAFPLDVKQPFIGIVGPGGLPAGLFEEREVWQTDSGHTERTNASVSPNPDGAIGQYASITRRLAPIREWGQVVVGYLNSITIRRRTIICYTANKLGGVHYDPTRLPRRRTDSDQFRELARAFDWNQEATTHAGIVCTYLACMELVRNRMIQEIHMAIESTLNSLHPTSRDS